MEQEGAYYETFIYRHNQHELLAQTSIKIFSAAADVFYWLALFPMLVPFSLEDLLTASQTMDIFAYRDAPNRTEDAEYILEKPYGTRAG